MTNTFTLGAHTEQAHDLTSALIDEAYARKASDSPTSPKYRTQQALDLCEEHYAQIGLPPARAVLSRLAWYIVFDEMTDANPHKASHGEYPTLSDNQLLRRRKKESLLSDVFTSKGDETIGRYIDSDGVRRRVYDYMTPARDMALVPTAYLDLYSALDNAGLTKRQRQAIELVYFGGMTQEDAGVEMGVKKNTLNEILARSYSKIKEFSDKTRTYTKFND